MTIGPTPNAGGPEAARPPNAGGPAATPSSATRPSAASVSLSRGLSHRAGVDPPFAVAHLVNAEHFGGIERAVMTLVAFRRAVQPSIVCLLGRDTGPDGPGPGGAGVPGCPVHRLPMRGRLDLTAAARLARHVRAHGVHLIHAHTLRANLVAAVAGRLARVPVVATRHSPVARDTEDRARNRRNLWLQRRLVRGTSGYIAVSDGLWREAIAAGVPPHRIVLVRNGLDARAFDHGHGAALRASLGAGWADARLVGTHALLRPRKGIDRLLRAIPAVVRAAPATRFLVAGTPETPGYGRELRDLADSLGVADHVRFLGFRSDVADFLAALDLFVFPSLFGEGAPFALLEAMAASRPIVATRSEGHEEIVEDGSSGVLVDPGDPGALAAAVTGLLADPDRARALGARAHQIVVGRFGAADMAAATETFYATVLRAHTSR